MIGARAPGEAGVLALAVGVPACWSFFGFFLSWIVHSSGRDGQLGTFVVEDQLAGAVPEPIDSGSAKIFQLCGMQAEQPHRERRWQRLAATSDSLHTGLIVARSRFFRLCGTMAKGPATGELLQTACRTRDSLPIGQAMTGSRVFRVCGKAAGRVAMWRWEPGFARAGEGWRRRMAPHPAQGSNRAGRAKKRAGPKALLRWIKWG